MGLFNLFFLDTSTTSQFACFPECESLVVLAFSFFGLTKSFNFSVALRYSSWTNVGDVRNFAALRSSYVVAALRGVSSAWSVNVPVEGSKGQHVERLLAQTKKDFDSAIKFLSHLSGENSDLVGMDLAAVDWPTTWSKLLHGASSMNTSSFKPRTPCQWDSFRASEVARLMKQKVDQLKKLARPYLVKSETLSPTGAASASNSDTVTGMDTSGGTGPDEAVAANAAIATQVGQPVFVIWCW